MLCRGGLGDKAALLETLFETPTILEKSAQRRAKEIKGLASLVPGTGPFVPYQLGSLRLGGWRRRARGVEARMGLCGFVVAWVLPSRSEERVGCMSLQTGGYRGAPYGAAIWLYEDACHENVEQSGLQGEGRWLMSASGRQWPWSCQGSLSEGHGRPRA